MNVSEPATNKNQRRYVGFISYSHADRTWAEWLHGALEAWRPPAGLETSSRYPLRPIFIDRAELPSSADLAMSIREALANSDTLLVVCSPSAATSKWVNEEVRAFKSLGRSNRVFCLLVAGNPEHDDCFPPALRFEVIDGVTTDIRAPEPLAADVRPNKDSRDDARLKLVSGMLGLPLDRLRQRDAARRQKKLVWIATSAAVGCIVFGALSVAAFVAKSEADRQRAIAERETVTAKRTAEFMKSLFEVSKPSESRGNSITAREVLDLGAKQIEQQLSEAPLIRADLRATLGEVYANLGLLDRSRELLEAAAATPDKSSAMSARIMTALGELQYRRGDYDEALRALASANKYLDDNKLDDHELRARLYLALGDVYFRRDDNEPARRNFNRALQETEAIQTIVGRAVAIRARHGIAQTDFGDGLLDDAARELQRAYREQLAISGERHPLVTEILNDLGSVEYARNRPPEAEKFFRECLKIERLLLGERHPDSAPTLNNLARVLLEQRKFFEARKLLEDAIKMRSEVIESGDLAEFVFSNYGLAAFGNGDSALGESQMIKALTIAVPRKHRLIAPIMTDLANLQCQTNRAELGLQQLTQARPIMVERYPNDPWRVALVDNVGAGCLTKLKRYDEARKLVESSTATILKRWPPDSMYGYDTVARAIELYERTDNQAQLAKYRSLMTRSAKS